MRKRRRMMLYYYIFLPNFILVNGDAIMVACVPDLEWLEIEFFTRAGDIPLG